jgi:hypothetical protein
MEEVSMAGKKELEFPPREFRLEILKGESDSNVELLERFKSETDEDHVFGPDDEYTMVEEIQSNIEQWIEDIEKGKEEKMSEDDLNFRLNILENQIMFHDDILRTDDTLDEDDRQMFKEDLEKIKEWRRCLNKLIGAPV